MYNQLSELESITKQLERITSMFNMMCEIYFDALEPNERRLKSGYTDYTNVIGAVQDMVSSQRNDIHGITDKLYKVYYDLKRLSEQNIAILEGGVSHD